MNNIDIIKILMADDDADDREFFREALADSGIANELTEVAGGRELLGLLSGGEAPIVPDVIFLDLHMPGLDGKFCLGEIRRQDQFSRVPVIILSTSTWSKDIEETYLGGASMYISKMAFYANSMEWFRRLFPPGDWKKTLLNPARDRLAFSH